MEKNTAASRLRTIATLLAILGMILVFGWVIGVIAAVVGSIFYLILLFPVGMGIAGGSIVREAVRVLNIRRASRLLLVSALMAAVIYVTFHYGRYVALQIQAMFELSAEMPDFTLDEKLEFAKIIVDYSMEEETGYSGFVGYMLFKAKTGISIGRFYSQNRLNLTSALAWMYWALEFGIILWVLYNSGRKQMSVLRCESCGKPYGREQHLGGTIPANEPLLLDLLQRSDMVELGKLIGKDTGLPSVELYMQRCDACGQSSSHITVRRALPAARGGVTFADVSRATLPPQESRLFLQQLQPEVD